MSPTIRDGRRQRETYAVALVGGVAGPVERRVAGEVERGGFTPRRTSPGLALAAPRPSARVVRAEDLTPPQRRVVVALVNADRETRGEPPIRLADPEPPEEPAMPADLTPSLVPVVADPSVTLQVLKEAATAAQNAWAHLAAAEAALGLAEEAWLDSRLALAAAWHDHAGVAEARRDPPEQAESEPPTPAVEEPADDAPEVVTQPAARRPAGGGPEVAGLSRGQAKVLAAVVKHDGDRRGAAGELYMTIANVEAHLWAAGKKGLLPIDLIPKLPARFARFTGAQG